MKKHIGTIAFAVLLAFFVLPWHAVFAQGSAHSIKISWTAYTQGSDVATGLFVYRGTATGGPYTKQNTTALPIATTIYTDATGAGGTKYFYVLTAVDAGGFESLFSNEASATMLSNPIPPSGVTATAQ